LGAARRRQENEREDKCGADAGRSEYRSAAHQEDGGSEGAYEFAEPLTRTVPPDVGAVAFSSCRSCSKGKMPAFGDSELPCGLHNGLDDEPILDLGQHVVLAWVWSLVRVELDKTSPRPIEVR
jgi:hypothetical protein